METFAEARAFVKHESYARDRQGIMEAFDPRSIDPPILDLILAFARLPHCFTLQSCFGHFVSADEPDPTNLAPLAAGGAGPVRYRIAYAAFCIEGGVAGARLRDSLAGLCGIDPDYVQFGSPGWFWERQPNTYALQVEPRRFMFQDTAVVEYDEALHIERIRERFFEALRKVVTVEESLTLRD